MNLATIRSALSTWIASATGIPAASVFWKTRPIGWTGAQYAIASIAGTIEQGRDEVVWNYSAARPLGSELVPHQVGLRSAVVTVQIWSHNSTDTLDALALCERMRDRVRLPETTDALYAAGLGLANVEMLRDLSELQDDRTMSVAELAIRVNADADTTGTAIGYVEHWTMEGYATTADGAVVKFLDGTIP